MGFAQFAMLPSCCGVRNQCCSNIDGIWYLCLAIVVMIVLVSCNDLLRSQCFFIGLPWGKSKMFYINGIGDDDMQLQQVLNDLGYSCEQQTSDELHKIPPPPYSVIDPFKDSLVDV